MTHFRWETIDLPLDDIRSEYEVEAIMHSRYDKDSQLTSPGRRHLKNSSAKINRRELFSMGGLAIGSVSPIGLTLEEVLASEETGPSRTPINVIFMFLQGGASHLDMYDMKETMPAEIRGKYHPAPTSVSGLQLCEKLPKLASCANHFSLIRSMHSYTSKHGEGDVHIMCGSELDKNLQAPGIGAVLSQQQKQQAPIPPFVHVGDMKHPAYTAPGFGGYMGRTYDPYLINQDPSSKNFSVKEFETGAVMDVSRLAGRKHLLKSLDRYQANREKQLEFAQSHNRFSQRALELSTSRKAKQAFDLSQEPEKIRNAYGNNRVGQGMLLARRLVEAGVRFVTVQGYVDTGIYAWDHHWGIYPHLEQQLPIYDNSYSALLTDLADRGMLDTTLVITAGEFGRTPKINSEKRGPGRDHWGQCFSLTLGGGGVKTGRIIGASDKNGAVPTDRPVSVADFVATVYHALGIDAKAKYLAQGRSMTMLPHGNIVRELF
jgi:hypothetical protein